MKPFSEELDPSDPRQARAAELLRAGGPLRESEVSLRAVRRKLDAPRAKLRLAGLRPALVAGLLVSLAGSAAAAYGVSRLITGGRTPVEAGRAAAPEASVGGARLPHRAPISLGSVRAHVPPVAVTPSGAEPVPQVHSARPQVPVVERTTTQKAQAAAPQADPGLLHQAVEALRTSGDPKKAAELLKKYEKSGATGALHEEALALSIEAALANRDPHAQELARRYLAEYPKGRFRALALRAIEGAKARQ